MKRLAIIGGGASGLMAAITAASQHISVDIFEKNSSVGKKILASGNGRCNIINTHYHNADFSSSSPDFSSHALEKFNFTAFEKFAQSIGLFLDKKDDGRCYPMSNEAKAVVNALLTRAQLLGVSIITDAHVTSLAKENSSFSIQTATNTYDNYDYLLITSGSEAAPQLGGSDEGYTFAKTFGHSINLTYPALVQLHIDSNVHHKMSGVRKEASVHLYINNSKEMEQKGDILFTKYGISGLAILDISERAAYALAYYSEVKISLNLFADMDKAQLASHLNKLCTTLPQYPIHTILSGMIASKISATLLEFVGITPDTPASTLSPKMLKKIIHTLQDWRFNISDTHGFKHAEVSGGGVNCDEINPKTMASTQCKGLYFAGEVLDVVGRRGGFNFAWAWASAFSAANAIVKHANESQIHP